MNYQKQSSDVASYFDRIALEFDSYYEAPKGWLDNMTNEMLRKPVITRRLELGFKTLQPMPKKTILDIGCGSGVLSVPLAKEGHRVIGVDFSSVMIDIAKKRAQSVGVLVDFRVADFMKQDFEPVDACVAFGVLEYFKNPHDFTEKMLSLVPSGGIVVFDLPSIFNIHTPLRLPYLLVRKQRAYFYTKTGVARVLEPLNTMIASKTFLPYGAGWVIVLTKQ